MLASRYKPRVQFLTGCQHRLCPACITAFQVAVLLVQLWLISVLHSDSERLRPSATDSL